MSKNVAWIIVLLLAIYSHISSQSPLVVHGGVDDELSVNFVWDKNQVIICGGKGDYSSNNGNRQCYLLVLNEQGDSLFSNVYLPSNYQQIQGQFESIMRVSDGYFLVGEVADSQGYDLWLTKVDTNFNSVWDSILNSNDYSRRIFKTSISANGFRILGDQLEYATGNLTQFAGSIDTAGKLEIIDTFSNGKLTLEYTDLLGREHRFLQPNNTWKSNFAHPDTSWVIITDSLGNRDSVKIPMRRVTHFVSRMDSMIVLYGESTFWWPIKDQVMLQNYDPMTKSVVGQWKRIDTINESYAAAPNGLAIFQDTLVAINNVNGVYFDSPRPLELAAFTTDLDPIWYDIIPEAGRFKSTGICQVGDSFLAVIGVHFDQKKSATNDDLDIFYFPFVASGETTERIKKTFNSTSASLFPSPAKSHVQLSGTLPQYSDIIIQNLDGKMEILIKLHPMHSPIEISELNPGFYFLTYWDLEQVPQTIKWIKN